MATTHWMPGDFYSSRLSGDLEILILVWEDRKGNEHDRPVCSADPQWEEGRAEGGKPRHFGAGRQTALFRSPSGHSVPDIV